MAEIAYSGLADHLESGDFAPVYVLVGDQDLLREFAGREILETALGDGDPSFNLDKLDGETAGSDEIISVCNMFPMMAGRRVVLVRRAARMAQDEALADYVTSPAPQTTLVLDLEKSPDARRKAWKKMSAEALIVRCQPLKERELEIWVGGEARRRKLGLGREEIRYLASEFGSDLRRLLNELDKISLYAGKQKLTVDDLGPILGRGRAQSVFNFTEAVANRDGSLALKQLGRLLEEGESPLPILALIDRTVGQLLVAKELRQNRSKPANAARLLGVPHWKVDRVLGQSERFSTEELMRALDGLAQCDRALKTTGVRPRLLLESLVTSMLSR
jgi:DNA polymerase-3 subunit delta